MKNLEQNQAAFDKAVKGVVEQGRPAFDKSGLCVYRTTKGLKCAVGQLISDSEYNERIEGKAPGELIKCLPSFKELDLAMLYALRDTHDLAATRSRVVEDSFILNFLKSAFDVAATMGLDTSVVKEVAHERGLV